MLKRSYPDNERFHRIKGSIGELNTGCFIKICTLPEKYKFINPLSTISEYSAMMTTNFKRSFFSHYPYYLKQELQNNVPADIDNKVTNKIARNFFIRSNIRVMMNFDAVRLRG